MINFIPNDPLAMADIPLRQQAPRPDRPATRAGFTFITPAPAEGVHAPGTPEFLFWQSREAALAAVEAWEVIEGPLTSWAVERVTNPRKLPLLPDADDVLNAFYDGDSLSFFHHTTGGKTTYSGASTDVVAHETGHALLDSIRPDLWDSPFTEIGAFHEAFGDCVGLVTAFFDSASRKKVLQVAPSLDAASFLEAFAEDLSDGVLRQEGPNNPSSAPRHAFNNFQWSLPSTLPSSGKPAVLTSEVHSFGRIFSGCFYDTIRNIFAAGTTKTEATLLTAVQTAARVLVAGTRQATMGARFYQAVGRSMVVADQTLHNGANRAAITTAFNRHGLALGTSAMLAPRAALDGAAPRLSARRGAGAVLSEDTVRDLKRRLALPSSARLSVDVLNFGKQKIARATHVREVSLASIAKELKGVVALVPEQVMVGAVAKSAALVGALPEQFTTEDEVRSFIATLMEHGQLDLGGPKAAASVRRAAVAETGRAATYPTHRIATRGRKRVVERVRFACRAHRSFCGCCTAPI